MRLIVRPQERTRFLKFLFVGAFGALVDFSIFNLVVNLTASPAVVAQAISFLAAVVSNFLWNRYWTYPDSRSKPVRSQLVQFGIVSVIGLSIRTPIVALLDRPMMVTSSLIFPRGFIIPPTVLGHNIALAIGVLIVLLWNFFANRFWTYNDVS
jgi:putative flippase GtrA